MSVARPAPRLIPGEVLLCGLLAAAASAAVVALVPAGGDVAAHLYRTLLVRRDVLVWDNLWFAGDYPLSAYSVLYYPLAATVGIAPLGICSAIAAAALFALVAHRQWQAVARWPSRLFAILIAGQVFTAAYPFDAGLAMLLGAVWASQARRPWLAAAFTVLTLGFSPLAFLFLAVALGGLAAWRRRVTRQSAIIAAAGALAAGAQLALLHVLPTPPLVYPYGIWRLLAGLIVAGLGTALALRAGGSRPLAAIFVAWAAASVLAELVPSPIGRNMLRASLFGAPLMLLAATLVHWRPRVLSIAAVTVALAANVSPYATMISYRSADISASAGFWRPIIRFLRRHNRPDFRVEVAGTRNHWEDYFLPRAGIPLARGWYTQLDLADNSVLFRPTLTAPEYRDWLRRRAVRYVVLPHLTADRGYGGIEPKLLTGGRSGLRTVWTGRQATIYRLPDATPLLTGPGPATITRFTSTTVQGSVGRPGTYRLRIAFNPYWAPPLGAVCLTSAGHATTLLHARRRGPFVLRAIEDPTRLIGSILTGRTDACP